MQGGIPKPPEPIMNFNRDELKGLPFTFPTEIHRYVNALHLQTKGVMIIFVWRCTTRKRCACFLKLSNELYGFSNEENIL